MLFNVANVKKLQIQTKHFINKMQKKCKNML